MKSRFYIILVNFNGLNDTIECLESLNAQKNQDFQIIVIDNSDVQNDFDTFQAWASGKEPIQIETSFPEFSKPFKDEQIDCAFVMEEVLEEQIFDEKLLVVKARKNQGFAAANNVALRYLKRLQIESSWIWLLNNDTVVAKNVINEIKNLLCGFSINDIRNTLFGTPLLEYDRSNKIQAIGGKYNKISGITSHIGEGIKYTHDLELSNFKIDYPIGASLILSSSFLEHIGLMSEEYFLFFEELDWVQRAKKYGGKTAVLPVFGVYHKQGKSTLFGVKNKKSEFIDLLSLRNRILISRKFYKKYLFTVKLFIVTATIFKRIISGSFDRIPKIIKLVITT